MTHDEVFICALFTIDIFVAVLVLASMLQINLLSQRNKAMALDFTGVQSSLSTLAETVGSVSATVSTLEASSDGAADQATLDGVTSSLAGLNTTLSALVPSTSTVSETVS